MYNNIQQSVYISRQTRDMTWH